MKTDENINNKRRINSLPKKLKNEIIEIRDNYYKNKNRSKKWH